MIYYQYIIAGILIAVLLNFIVNIIVFKNLSKFSLPDYILKSPPLISILIPARNEAENIGRCLASFMKQDYPNMEILVLDDNSSDNTGLIVKRLAKKDSRIKLFKGKPLKKGWLGKCYACQQLSEYAKGDYFIFTDADTLHFNKTVSNALAALLRNKVDALSAFPNQIMVSIHERMTVNFINFAILSFLPLILVKKAKTPFFCVAIGQFFLFKREVFEKIGGFEHVKTEIIEDVYLAKEVKKFGYKYMVFDGNGNISCRMYKNLKEVIKGFSRFIYAAFDFNVAMEAIAIFFVSILFLVPFILLPIGIFIFRWSGLLITLSIIQIFIVLTIKIILALKFKYRILDSLLTPISMVYMILLACNSYLQTKVGSGINWKGRTYNIENDEKGMELIENEIEDEAEEDRDEAHNYGKNGI
ncbi:MAG: glycosyltransferase family 2 protein [Actinobacteria bacterium]|nr:glycosyltransferase family 2 protein [Actinomycetota bacterium]